MLLNLLIPQYKTKRNDAMQYLVYNFPQQTHVHAPVTMLIQRSTSHRIFRTKNLFTKKLYA